MKLSQTSSKSSWCKTLHTVGGWKTVFNERISNSIMLLTRDAKKAYMHTSTLEQWMKTASWSNNIHHRDYVPFTLTREASCVMTRNAQTKYNISERTT